MSCPTIAELHTPSDSISRPSDRYVRFLGVLLDENLSFKWQIQIIRSENFPWTWDHPKIKAFIDFPYPPSFILLSDLPLYNVTVRLCGCPHFPRYLLLFTIFMRKRREFSSRLHTLLLTSSKLKMFMFYLYLRWHINTSREISPCCFSGLLKLVGEVNLYMVRNREDVMIPAGPSVRSDFGLAVTVGHAWNLVPAEIRQSRTLGSFKRQMKSFSLKASY